MEFYKKLQHVVDKSGKSKKEAIALLQLSDSSFEGLDSVTFSRWLNNKTEPSLYKQFLILRAFNESIASILTDFDKEVPESFNQLLDNIFNVIESPYHYAVVPPKAENEDQIIYLTSTLNDFAIKHTLNKNIQTYNKIKLRLNNNNPTVYEIQVHRKDNTTSYISYIKDVAQLEEENQNKILVSSGFFIDSEAYLKLSGLIIHEIINNMPNCTHITFMMRGKMWIDLFESLGASLVESHSERKSIGNIFFYTIELPKLLSHPHIASIYKNTKPIYEKSKNIEFVGS